jgi:adenylate kinase
LEQAKQRLSSKRKKTIAVKMSFTYCLGIYPICLKQQQTKKQSLVNWLFQNKKPNYLCLGCLFLQIYFALHFMFNLILFGPPGSGKGTQSAHLLSKYKLQHISTGDLLRDEVSRKTALGLEAKKSMDEGALVPDEVVIGMISSKIDENPSVRGFIFDGFPRTKQQAIALDQLLDAKKAPINLVLALEVPDVELTKRILNRALTSGRADDTEEVIKKRVEEYRAKTEVVASYYEEANKVKRINGEGSVAEIFALLTAEIDPIILPE